jgi:hypothetical protein
MFQAIDQIPRTCPKRLEFVPRYSGHFHALLSRKVPDTSGVSMPGLFTEEMERRPGFIGDVMVSENDSDKMYINILLFANIHVSLHASVPVSCPAVVTDYFRSIFMEI